MAKTTLSDLTTLSNETSAIAIINSNMHEIANALDDTLSRTGVNPNALEHNVDANTKRLYNLPTPSTNTEVATKGYVDTLAGIFDPDNNDFPTDDAAPGFIELAEQSTPATPGADIIRVFARDDSGTTKLATVDHAGTVRSLYGGPSSATDNAIVRFDGTSGGTYQNSGVLINDSNDLFLPTTITQDSPGGVYLDFSPSVNIARLDRVFVGEAENATGYSFNIDNQGSIIPTSTQGAAYLIRDAQLLSIHKYGLVAVSGISRTSDNTLLPIDVGTGFPFQDTIGVSGAVINNAAGGIAWGLYSDIQHEAAGNTSYGVEFAIKNKGANLGTTSHGVVANTVGSWYAAGGDASYGGSPANPSSCAILIGSNSSKWNTGVCFIDGGLANNPATGFPTAISLAKGHRIHWGQSGNFAGATIRSDVNTQNNDVHLVFANNAVDLLGVNGKAFLQARTVASGVNFVDIVSATTTVGPTISAQGDDTNVDLNLAAKGTGSIKGGTLTSAVAMPMNCRTVASVNFNSANTDTSLSIVLPPGYTRYRINQIIISGASASISTATWGLFTAAAGGGTAISAAGQAITVSSASESTANNMMVVAPATISQNTESFNNATLFFRVGTAQGSAATATVSILYSPVS